MYHTIQPTIIHSNQATRPGHNDQDYFPIGSLDSGTDVTRYGWNIENQTGMNPQVRIVTTIPESESASNRNIFDSVSRISYIFYRGSPCHGAAKSEGENLGGNKNFENTEQENNFEAEKVGRKNSVIWNQNDSDSIHVDLNHIKSILN